MSESVFDKLVIAATVLYFLVNGLVKKHWEFIAPVVWGLCLIGIYHAFKAAHAVAQEISTDANERIETESGLYTADDKLATVVRTIVPPRFYQVKLYSIAGGILALCLLFSYSAWTHGHKAESAQAGASESLNASRLQEIKDLDQLVAQPDEWALREVFGMNEMIKMNFKLVQGMAEYCNGDTNYLDPTKYSAGKELLIVRDLTNGRTKEHGGATDVMGDCGTVFLAVLPTAYSINTRKLETFEASSILPASITRSLKDLEGTIKENAETLVRVEDEAIKMNPKYFLEYDDPKSPFFHVIDRMYLDRFIDLKPKADNVSAEIRKVL